VLRTWGTSGAGYGAIGGATSALLANQIAGIVTNGQGNPSPEQLATITALTMLAGGGMATLLGQNSAAAAIAAQNEVLNNTCGPEHTCGKAVDQPLTDGGAVGGGGGQIRFGSAPGAEGDVASDVTKAQQASSDAQSLGGNVRLYPDGSLRTPDGKFASVSGSPPPGTNAASQFADYLSSNGVNVVGQEVVVNGPLGARRFDIVTQDANGVLHGIEIKSGGASPTLYQQFKDKFVNMFGVSGTGRFAGQTISTATTGFTDYSTGAAARNGFQIFFEPGNAASWSSRRLRRVQYPLISQDETNRIPTPFSAPRWRC
jgi:filamentous hemagglutinin